MQTRYFRNGNQPVKQLAKGKYQAGHYELPWQGGSGSGVDIVQMKAAGLDKRWKLVRLK